MSKATILIIEDEPLLREAFRLMLEDSDYAVFEAGSGRDGIAKVRDERPDLVLLDLGLPDMNGLDVARAIKADPTTAATVLVALTGSVGSQEKKACLEAGCTAYLAKPFSPREFLKRLPDLLGR